MCNSELEFFPVNTIIKEQNDEYDVVKCKATNKAEFNIWLKQYCRISNNIYRLLYTRIRAGVKVAYKATYRCQRNTLPRKNRKPSKMHTNCPAKLLVTIRAANDKERKQQYFSEQEKYPAEIKITKNHNHVMGNTEIVPCRDLPDSMKEKLLDLFKHHGPAKSLRILKENFFTDCEHDYSQISGSSWTFPTYKTVWYTYNKYSKSEKKEHVFPNQSASSPYINDVTPTDIAEIEILDEISLSSGISEIAGSSDENIILRSPEKTLNILQSAFRKIEEHLLGNYSVQCSDAVDAFYKSCTNIKSTEHFIGALHSFGKA